MKEKAKDIEQYLSDAIIGLPYGFTVGGQHFFLYPVTLGKMYLLQRQIDALGLNNENLHKDVSHEALRIAETKKVECLNIISYHTCQTPQEVFDSALIAERVSLFEKELSQEDIAALMIIVLTTDKTGIFFRHLGIDKEQERLGAVMRIKTKGDKNNLSFGGKSIYGTLIDAACERYGWTKEYVVWGIDYTSLRLMLSDKISTVYCSDDELKRIPLSIRSGTEEVIRPTRENMQQIKKMDWR